MVRPASLAKVPNELTAECTMIQGRRFPPAIKDRDQQEADRDGKDYMAQAICKIHTASANHPFG